MNNLIVDFENSIEYIISNSDFGAWLLQRYKLADKIYQSSISRIFILKEYSTGELFTLKVITDSAMFGDLEILKKISHPNIVSIKDVFYKENYVFIIQSYIKGLTLNDYIEKYGVFTEAKTIEIAKKLCGIFEYLHNFENTPLIFRDLKPANIIMCDDGEIKLIDLASIRKFKSESQNDTIHIGTIGFASPEQFGYGQSDLRSDLYTIGATLYYLLTGNKPISNKLRIKDIRDIRKDISIDLAGIVDKCTRFDPDERYQHIDGLKGDLYLIGEKHIKKLFRNILSGKYIKLLFIALFILLIMLITIFYVSNKSSESETIATKNVQNKETAKESTETFSFDKTTIVEAFWSGTLPRKLTRNMQILFEEGPPSEYSDNTFHISIAEWDKTKDHKQMDERIFRVDSKLILRAEGYKDVQADISPGSITAGDGSGQVYVCFLANKENMVSGVKYSIVDESGHWIIPDDVFIERPIK